MNEFKQERKLTGLSQRQAAEKTGVTLRSIQCWEQGTRKPNEFVRAAYFSALTNCARR